MADFENSSTTAEWVPNEGAEIVDDTTVSLTIENGGATSIETQNLNVPGAPSFVPQRGRTAFDFALNGP